MRKLILICLLVLALCVPVLADGPAFYLAEDEILSGMGSRSWHTGYTPEEKNDTWTAYLPIAGAECEEVTVALVMADDGVSPFKPQDMTTTARRNSEGIYPAKLSLKLFPDCQCGDYPATVLVTGDGKTASFPLVVRIRQGYENRENPGVSLALGECDLTVGTEGECIILVRNGSRTLALTDCVLRISESTADLLPGASDTIPIGSLLGGEEREVAVPIAVSAGARVGYYQLHAELTYETLGGEGKWQEVLTVSVNQAMRLEHGDVTMGDSIIQGGTGGISMNLMNLGAGEVKNICMTLSLGDFVKDQTVLVGNLLPGASTVGKLSFSTAAAPVGEVEGRLTVTYEDAFGNAEAFTAPVNVTVEPPKPIPSNTAIQEAEGSPTPWVWIGLCGLLVLALIAQGAILLGKIHKLEEDKL